MKKAKVKWRWVLPVVMVAAYVCLSFIAATVYDSLERSICAGRVGCIGTGYSTRPGLVRMIVGGPFLLTWQSPVGWYGGIVVYSWLFAPAVFVFWWWMGWLLEGKRVRSRGVRVLLVIVGLLVSGVALWEARSAIDMALIKGAGEWKTWKRVLTSPSFISDSTVWFLHGFWMIALVLLWWMTVFSRARAESDRPLPQTADPTSRNRAPLDDK